MASTSVLLGSKLRAVGGPAPKVISASTSACWLMMPRAVEELDSLAITLRVEDPTGFENRQLDFRIHDRRIARARIERDGLGYRPTA
jgi:hypothetical protein